MSATVRVFVVDYLGRDVLPQCLTSLDSTVPAGIPISVIDNASPTPSDSLIPENLKNRIEVLRLEINKGYAGAIAEAWNRANEDFLVIANNDLEFTPGWLETLLSAAEKENAHAVSAVISHAHETELDQSTNSSLNPLFYLIPGIFTNRSVAVYPSGACFLLRKDPSLPNPPVDPEYFMYYEDVYIGFLLRALGNDTIQCPDAVVKHSGSHSVGKVASGKIAFLQERNRLITQSLFLDCGTLFLVGLLNSIDFLFKPFTCIYRKKPYWPTIGANWWILFHWLSLWKKHIGLRKLPGFKASRNYPYLTSKMVPDSAPMAGLVNGFSRFWLGLWKMPVDNVAREGEE
jgi:GT2 family glycosyltransferase